MNYFILIFNFIALMFSLNLFAHTPFTKPFGHGSVTSQIKTPICTDGVVSTSLVSAPRLYIGGLFTQIGPCSGGAFPIDISSGLKHNSFDWSKIGIVGAVNSIISDGAGGWYLGGDFTTVGSTTRNYLVKITSSYTVDTSFNANLDGSVTKLVLNGSDLFIAGNFRYVGSYTRPYLALALEQ